MDPQIAAALSTLIGALSTAVLMYAAYNWPAGRRRGSHADTERSRSNNSDSDSDGVGADVGDTEEDDYTPKHRRHG